MEVSKQKAMKRNLMLVVILVLCINCTLIFTACGNDKQVSESYERGYGDGYSAGLADKQSEWDKWWETAYYDGDVIEREDADALMKYAIAAGLVYGYEARKDKLNLVGIDWSLSGHDFEYEIGKLLEQFPLKDDGNTDHLNDLFYEVIPQIIDYK